MSAELVEALKRKEAVAFERRIAQHGAMLYRVALRLMGQRQEAEDILQEVLLKVHENIHTFDGRAALTTWLYRIVVNTALMRLRSKARLPEELLDTAGPLYTEGGDHAHEVAEWALPPEEMLLRAVSKGDIGRLFRQTEGLRIMTRWTWLTGRLREWFIKLEARFCHARQPPGMLHCRQVVALIMGYLEGTLEPDERCAFEAHIADCRNCWRFLHSYREAVALGQRLRGEEIPFDVRERLETFLHHRLQPPS